MTTASFPRTDLRSDATKVALHLLDLPEAERRPALWDRVVASLNAVGGGQRHPEFDELAEALCAHVLALVRHIECAGGGAFGNA